MFMLKPPSLESLRFCATPRMLRWLLVILFAILIPTVGASLAREFFPLRTPVPGQIPVLDFTTDGSRYSAPPSYVLFGSLPPPGPNQKRAGSCTEKAAQVAINGGCWVKTETPPPCPEGFQWEHDGKCWLPVARAASVPTSGGGTPVTVADPE
jgi:hypothetical protein